MALVAHSGGSKAVPNGSEAPIINWVDVRVFEGHKTLLVEVTGASPVKFRVYQADYNKDDVKSPEYDGGRIDYDFPEFTVPAGEQRRLPIYDDGASEVLRITGEGVGGVSEVKAKMTGPAPVKKRAGINR